MKQRTTAQIEKTTLERMKTIKITKRESYDEIMNRLMDMHTNSKLPEPEVKHEATQPEGSADTVEPIL